MGRSISLFVCVIAFLANANSVAQESRRAGTDNAVIIKNRTNQQIYVLVRATDRGRWSDYLGVEPGRERALTMGDTKVADFRFLLSRPNGTLHEFGMNAINVADLASVGPGVWNWGDAPFDQYGVYFNYTNGQWKHLQLTNSRVGTFRLLSTNGNVVIIVRPKWLGSKIDTPTISQTTAEQGNYLDPSQTTDEPGIQPDKVISWLAVLLCFLLSMQFAFANTTNNEILFLAISLYALSWAVLFPYYDTDVKSEILPAFNGFLLAIVGVLFAHEAKRLEVVIPTDGATPPQTLRVLPTQTAGMCAKLGLGLLTLIVSPSVVSFLKDWEFHNWIKFSDYTAALLINLLLSGVGYAVLYAGLDQFSRKGDKPIHGIWSALLALVLLTYLATSVVFTCKQIATENTAGEFVEVKDDSEIGFWSTPSTPPMTKQFRYIYASLKVVLTVVLLLMVLWSLTPPASRNRQRFLENFFKIFLAPLVHARHGD